MEAFFILKNLKIGLERMKVLPSNRIQNKHTSTHTLSHSKSSKFTMLQCIASNKTHPAMQRSRKKMSHNLNKSIDRTRNKNSRQGH